jgi:hypothetical protein
MPGGWDVAEPAAFDDFGLEQAMMVSASAVADGANRRVDASFGPASRRAGRETARPGSERCVS